MANTKKWDKHLQPIIDDFNEGGNEALDGDDVDFLVKIIKLKLNFMQGNLTQKEYDTKLARLKWKYS